MIKISSVLPDWIANQAPLESKVIIDKKIENTNDIQYVLTARCPLLYEKYAVLFHPFIIDKERKDLPTLLTEYEKINWKKYFELTGREFSLFHAIEISRQDGEQNNSIDDFLIEPEGDIDFDDLKSISKIINSSYPNQLVNFYYSHIKTKTWEEDIIYKGTWEEIDLLLKMEEISESIPAPSAIYPDGQEWCIVSDYDFPFSVIGGSKKLIDDLLSIKEIEIFEVAPLQ